jgi:hypothetical protein
VALEFRRDAWMRVQVDGRIVSARLFKAGEKQQILDADTLSIRIGDAGAVLASVNGNQPRTLGRDEEVVTRHFAAEEAAGLSVAPVQTAAAASPRWLSSVTSTGAQTLAPIPAGERTSFIVVPSTAESSATPPSPVASQHPLEPSAPRTASSQQDMVSASQQWLDAYYRGDLAALGTNAPSVLKSPTSGCPTRKYPLDLRTFVGCSRMRHSNRSETRQTSRQS